MIIKSVSSKNFRTLENFRLDFSQNYCALSGKNNAGKSAVIRIVRHFFDDNFDYRFYSPEETQISFLKDATQWNPTATELEISVTVEISKMQDSEVFFVVQTYSSPDIPEADLSVCLTHTYRKDETSSIVCRVQGCEIEGQKASEITQKFKSTPNLVVHNSINPNREMIYSGSGLIETISAYFSEEDKKRISDAEKNLQSKVKRAARHHKEELDSLLFRLKEKYRVDLSSIERGRSSHFPMEIKLTDKSVDVALTDWGAGTQNRTRVLVSVLEAARMRSATDATQRSAPVFLVEEPESFLHPSAQAEFGQVLNELSEELQIQIIATTHSPYMLNQRNPSANVLLERKIFRGLPRETQVCDTAGDDWMRPFADNLGIVPDEFISWKSAFGAHGNNVILVEGEIDYEYFLFFKENYPKIYSIPEAVEIVPYGGKDALKNTSILQFMINKFGRVYITFDLDAKIEVKAALERIGLRENDDFCAIGLDSAGSDCMEGLLPALIKQKVYSDCFELVTRLSSAESKERNSAKNELKRRLLDEFKITKMSDKELSLFKELFVRISKAFKTT